MLIAAERWIHSSAPPGLGFAAEFWAFWTFNSLRPFTFKPLTPLRNQSQGRFFPSRSRRLFNHKPFRLHRRDALRL